VGVNGSFELSRVRVTEDKNQFWFELARGSSYGESTVCVKIIIRDHQST